MSAIEWVSLIAALVALLISFASVGLSVLQTRLLAEAQVQQANTTAQALQLQQASEGNTIILQFVTRYFDLMRDGGIFERIHDEKWAYQLWSLHATEFYFYHYGLLPVPMYAQWMIEIAELYSTIISGERIRNSHVAYLRTYAQTYPEMNVFFQELYQIMQTSNDMPTRKRRTAEHVMQWIQTHRVIPPK